MKLRNIISALLVTAGCFTASAQTTETKEVFNPHWFVQAQGGAQYNVGEVSFGDLITPNVQISGGYLFNSVLGVRLSVNAWESKAGSNVNFLADKQYTWKWNYVAPMIDVNVDLTNLIGGYNPHRLCTFGIFGGLGANIAFGNGEASDVQGKVDQIKPTSLGGDVMYLRNLWGGTNVLFTGRFGANLDFHISKRIDLGLEINANMLDDQYNSKRAGNIDWYINALAGVKVHLGKVSKTKTVKRDVEQVIVEKIVEKPVEKVVEKVVYRDREVAKPEPLRRDIYFPIRGSQLSKEAQDKVDEIVAYLKKYPEAKVSVTGYADKGTGNAKLNMKYSEQRVAIVTAAIKNAGIDASRITSEAKGDTEQPFTQNDLNRVTICIAK